MMVRSLTALLSELHAKLLHTRNIERFAQLDSFGIAYNMAEDNQKSLALKYISNLDKINLVRWTRIQLRDCRAIEELPVKELRKLCSELGVKGYRHLTKVSLVGMIKANIL